MAEEKEEAGPAKPAVRDEDLREAYAGEALHSNRMFATNLTAGVRVAFMEQLGDKVPPQFRTAVLLSYTDAIQLRDLLSRQLKDFEKVNALEIEIGPDGKPRIKNG